jgi:thermosome subunit
MKGKIGNMKSSDIIEPLAVKLQIVSAASEAACMLLRIDDVIATPKVLVAVEEKEECHLEWVVEECHLEWVVEECHLEWVVECLIWAE